MSKRADPVVKVLHYFETADLPLARQALVLAQAILRRRTPGSHSIGGSRPAKKRVVRSGAEEEALKQLAGPLV